MVITVDTGLVNVFLLVEERTVIVDAGYAGREGTVLEALERLGVGAGAASLLVVTHGHLDHFGGAAALRDRLGVPVLAHRADADCLRRGRNAEMRMAATLSDEARAVFLGKVMRMRAAPLEPEIVIDGPFDLAPFGVAARLIHTPGHSPGSLSVALESGDVIVADLVAETRVAPRRLSLPIFFDDLAEARRSLEQVLALAPRSLLASHGRPCRPDEVRSMLDELDARSPPGRARLAAAGGEP